MTTEFRSILPTILWIAGFGVAAGVIVIVTSRRLQAGPETLTRRLLLVWFAAALLGLGYVTLTPIGGRPQTADSYPLDLG